jgi:hypothetical protein
VWKLCVSGGGGVEFHPHRHEKIAYELADAGMHFIFSGHNHMNDVAAIVSGNNESFL